MRKILSVLYQALFLHACLLGSQTILADEKAAPVHYGYEIFFNWKTGEIRKIREYEQDSGVTPAQRLRRFTELK